MTASVWQAMRTIFLADAHINHSSDPQSRGLLHFIQQLHGEVDCLCILGDLFDFRVGLPQMCFPEHEPILDALSSLSSSGTRIIYLEGNHDFHLGAAFAKRIGAELYVKPITLDLGGRRVHLCHGDLINQADLGYRFMYRLFRSSLVLSGASLVPNRLIHAVRRRLQRTSHGQYETKIRRWNYPDVIRGYAEQIVKTGCSLTVVGHFHQSQSEWVHGMQLIVLGDWLTTGQYAELDDSGVHLRRFEGM